MKRAPIVLAATAAGLAATLGFSPHSKAPTASAVNSTPAPATKTTTSSASSKTVTSDAVSTQYGPVQLKVTIAGGKITSIEAVQLPSDDPKSMQIASYAEPLLRQSALSAQSANIDVVSGATYTSEGYKTALQSALDQAGFQASVTSYQRGSAA
jgi:uncharacterized protein with FMN-binding domain